MSTSPATTDNNTAILEALAGRSSSYRMFSRLFLKPLDEDDIKNLATTDFARLSRDLEGEGDLATGFANMARDLKILHTGTRQLLATDYTMCFDGVATYNGDVAVPYESVFLGEEALLNQEPRNQVLAIYNREGVSLGASAKVPEDHLAFELEFLAMLSDRCLKLLQEGTDKDEAVRVLQVSRDFITRHIQAWLPQLSERANKLLETRFYRGVLQALKGYLELDLEIIDDIIATI
jgi:TorA maturation chaperone TorD